MKLKEIAYARSGDKGSDVNIGVIALDERNYPLLKASLTQEKVQQFFSAKEVIRYELPNLAALNFILVDILEGGASLNLKIDAQGKGLGQALLEMEIDA